MFEAIVKLFLSTLIPGLELRFSIPFGFFAESIRNTIGLWGVVSVCLLSNILLGMAIFDIMAFIERNLRKWSWFDQHIWPILLRRREKLRPLIEKYGVWGVAVFIGIPLPGTGAYTGAIGAYFLNLDRKRFWLANFFGVTIAAIAVTTVCLLIDFGCVSEGSFIRQLFIKE